MWNDFFYRERREKLWVPHYVVENAFGENDIFIKKSLPHKPLFEEIVV